MIEPKLNFNKPTVLHYSFKVCQSIAKRKIIHRFVSELYHKKIATKCAQIKMILVILNGLDPPDFSLEQNRPSESESFTGGSGPPSLCLTFSLSLF